MNDEPIAVEEIMSELVTCPELRLSWFSAYGTPKCADASHEHASRTVRRHLHRSKLELPDGTVVVPVSLDPADPYLRSGAPDFGLYLDELWQPPWTFEHLDWPDLGLPSDAADAARALASLRDRARNGQRVEVGCLGGHGRTGTALACMAIIGGYPRESAVQWVRTRYCQHAIETPQQERFVARFQP